MLGERSADPAQALKAGPAQTLKADLGAVHPCGALR
jgi:hypothetical protein